MANTPHPPPESFARYVGIDVGGTNIKFGLCASDGSILRKSSAPTDLLRQPEQIIRHALEFCGQEVKTSGQLAGIGMAVPGVLDTSTWCLREVVNLPGWVDRPLLEILRNESHLPSVIINDANAAALAEHANRQLSTESLALLTLGTGIGCGLTIRGKAFGGDHGCAGELGHLAIQFGDTAAECTCGRRGHLEAYAGAPAVISRAKSEFAKCEWKSLPGNLQKETISPLDVANAAEDGFSVAEQVIRDTGKYIGQALGILGQVVDPAVVLLGGAMTFGGANSRIGIDFLETIRETVQDTTLQQVGSGMTIDFASLGNEAGVTGAALVARKAGNQS